MTDVSEYPKEKKPVELAWNMIYELRQEVREAQKIRTQVIGIKITFVSAAFGLVFNAKLPPYELLLIPAFVAIFFDFLIISYGYSIKRIGYYCRYYLEPKIRVGFDWPSTEPLWEEAMSCSSMKQHFARSGNLGITLITIICATLFIMTKALFWATGLFLIALWALFFRVYYIHDSSKHVPDKELCGEIKEKQRWQEIKNNKARK